MREADALTRFERENTELLAAKYELSSARAQVIAAGVLPNPTVGVGAAFLAHGVPTGGKQEVTLSLGQVVPVFGQVGARRDAAEAYATAMEREFAATLWALASEVRLRYVALAQAQAHVQLEQAALRDLGRVDAIIEQRTQGGANPEYDRLRIQAERSKGEGRVAEAEVEVAEARTALAIAIGKGVRREELIASELPQPNAPGGTLAELTQRALRQRPDATAARLRVDAANFGVTAVRRSYLPSPQISAGYTHAFAVPTDTGVDRGGVVFAQLAVPIPVFDRGQGSIDRGVAEAQAARARASSVELYVERDVERAHEIARVRFGAWQAASSTTAANTERMRSAAELSYREGRANVLELLDAYTAHREARLRIVDLQAAAVRATRDLERALGPTR
jgi:cobalt-zinc-cadmium efflux system outer membrane protein